eukprot:scaffold285815_cov33-Tisochrysis_lutea.AAC.1
MSPYTRLSSRGGMHNGSGRHHHAPAEVHLPCGAARPTGVRAYQTRGWARATPPRRAPRVCATSWRRGHPLE